jgi:hypothetical protein
LVEYARWYKPVIILDGLVFLVAFTALISGGENGEIIGSYGGFIGMLLFGVWFWHMKSVQTKSLQGNKKYTNQAFQEQTKCTKCGYDGSEIIKGLCSQCFKENEKLKKEQKKKNEKKVNYYQLLNVNERASMDEIKNRWREIAKEYHPDRASGSSIAEDEFIIYRKAYEILSDQNRRNEYDRQINLN